MSEGRAFQAGGMLLPRGGRAGRSGSALAIVAAAGWPHGWRSEEVRRGSSGLWLFFFVKSSDGNRLQWHVPG